MVVKAAYDVVVIGGGVGGLTSGAFLASRGRSVLVAERSPAVGGCCRSFRYRGFSFDAAVHHVSGGGPRSILGRALIELGARVDLVHLDPMDTLTWPDFRIEVAGDWERWTETLCRSFASQASGIRRALWELLRLYRAAVGSRGGHPVLERWQESSFADFLAAFVDDERLIRAFSGQWGYLGAPPQRLSAVGMCQMLVNYWRDGAFYPLGGAQALPDAIASALRRSGGDVAVSCPIRRICVEEGAATGVVLGDGRRVRARNVISNVDTPQTVKDLLGDAAPAESCAVVADREVSAPFFLLYLGLGPGFDIEQLPRGFHHRERRLGGPWIYVSSASAIDPSLAPAGKHAVTVVASLDETESRLQSWRQRAPHKAAEVVSQLDDLAPGLARHVEVQRYAHPPRAERRTRNFCGAPYGWAVIPGQAGPSRSATPPIRNLHDAGHWTEPGPGVCAVMASGWRTAKRVLEDGAGWNSTAMSSRVAT